jgi:hypothetical protein
MYPYNIQQVMLNPSRLDQLSSPLKDHGEISLLVSEQRRLPSYAIYCNYDIPYDA